mgnify:CR=1 FL=1
MYNVYVTCIMCMWQMWGGGCGDDRGCYDGTDQDWNGDVPQILHTTHHHSQPRRQKTQGKCLLSLYKSRVSVKGFYLLLNSIAVRTHTDSLNYILFLLWWEEMVNFLASYITSLFTFAFVSGKVLYRSLIMSKLQFNYLLSKMNTGKIVLLQWIYRRLLFPFLKKL